MTLCNETKHAEGFVGCTHLCRESSKTCKMQGLHEEHSNGSNAARDAYLEFNFFDGLLIDCSDMDGSWNSTSVLSDNLAIESATVVDTTRQTIGGTIDFGSEWDCILKEVCQERQPNNIGSPHMKQSLPKSVVSPNKRPCTSALGIYACDCEEDSIYCNLVTCMTSSSVGNKGKPKRATQEKPVHEEVEIKDYECKNQGSFYCVDVSSKSKGNGHNGRVFGSEICTRSPIAAWAAVVSDTPCCSSTPATGLVEALSPMTGSSTMGGKERVPTIASHLELTESALSQGKLCSDFEEDMGPGHASSVIASALKRPFAGLKLNLGSLSITDPAPYGTLHGVLHCTLKDGFPNYTFLLDDYEEVLTAKIWFDDMRLGQHHEIWKYTFYCLREEKKKKGKSGWKNWRRKDKLNAKLVGKMKVSSVVCLEEKRNLSVKSECILFSSRLDELAIVEEANVGTQADSSLCEAETCYCGDADCTVCSSPGMAATSFMSLYDSGLYMTPDVVRPLWQSSTPTESVGADIAYRRRPMNRCCEDSTIQRTTFDEVTQASPHRHSELAAMIIDVPLQMQSKKVRTKEEQHPEASITIILPSGNHGRPLCDLKGPSPLIRRWKEGGKCDCKGWDLGCGLIVLSNSRKKAKVCGLSEGSKLQKLEGEDQSRPLRLYKQDTDQEEAFFSLAPQANGLVALDFRAPLSPLQAFAIAVAILHGRDSNVPQRTHTVCTDSPILLEAREVCMKDEDGGWVAKENVKKSEARLAVNSKLQRTWEPQIALDNSYVQVHASGSAVSFERV